MAIVSSSSSSSLKKKTTEPKPKPSMSLRTIGRMGQSMSTMMPIKQKATLEENIKEEPGNTVEGELDHTPLPTINVSTKVWEQAQDNLLSDIQEVRRAMDLFLNSRIPEAEQILEPKRHSTLYHSLGHSFVLFLKSVMTFQHTDIEAAIEALKKTIQLADALRKKETGWFGNITSWVKGVSVQDIWAMSRLHRHAVSRYGVSLNNINHLHFPKELVYAESYLLKALLCIIHDESIVSFLREGLHVRSSYNTYKTLQKYLNHVRNEAMLGKDISSCELDDHFTSGVSLGVGLFNLMISLLPNSVMKLVEFIGFTSDRAFGMETLEAVGGWEEYAGLASSELPPAQEPNEGLRRQFCDMALMMYHIILSKLIPLSDVNEELSDRILAYSLKLYPDGVFFLFFSGRQLGARGQLSQAKSQYQKAIDTQKDWKQLQHMCFWELGLINLLQQNWQEAFDCYTILQKESNWSKAVYYYLQAISLFTLSVASGKSPDEQKELAKEAGEMMQRVTGAKQKIAGKSIPLEKFVSRKARKFIAQGNRLLFPDLEALNAFGAFDFMSVDLLYNNLERTTNEIYRLTHETTHEEMLNYYDDLCLSHYLRAMVLRLLLDQVKDTRKDEWLKLHSESIQCVMDNANKVQLDHYVYYFMRYEEARMMIHDQKYDEAKDIIQSIIKASDKGQFNVGAGPHAKNKYSLENTLLFKCHNCLTEIKTLSEENTVQSEEKDSDHFSSAANSIVSVEQKEQCDSDK
jgi:tetratricopeptide (TPR) repeat protein